MQVNNQARNFNEIGKAITEILMPMSEKRMPISVSSA